MSSTFFPSSNPLTTRPILLLTCMGLSLSGSFSIGSTALTYFALPSILLPSDAPLMPPLELVAERKARHFRTEKAPTQPGDSGVGDESEGVLDHGAVTKRLGSRAGSSEGLLLRQWFHVFAKGMHTFPPCAVGGALCYAVCAALVPGPLLQLDDKRVVLKRALYGLATLLSGGIMVFTLTVMKPVNSALHERVKEVLRREDEGAVEDGERKVKTEALIRQWGLMNSQRAIMPIMAWISAVAALLV